jgi:hypothetical protein
VTAVFLLPTAAIVGIYLLLAAANRFGLSGTATLQRLFLRSGVGAPTPFASPDFYVRLLWDFGGPVVIVTAGLAFLALLSRWKNLDPMAAIAVGSFAGIFLFFSAVHDKAPRAIVLWIPFAALVVAHAFSHPRLRGRVGWGLAALVCGACLINGWIGSDQARLVSGTGQVGRWLAAHPGTIFAERFPNVVIYTERQWDLTRGLDPAHAIVVPTGNVTIDILRQKAVRWVVVDADGLSYGDPAFKDVAACGQPVAEFNDPAGWSQLQFLETADSLHLGYDGVLAQRSRTLALSHGKQTIRIYDLATLPSPC